jgi:serine/threonine protein kinase
MRKLTRIQSGDLHSLKDGRPIAKGGRGAIYQVSPKRMLSPEIALNGKFLLKKPRLQLVSLDVEAFSLHLDEINRRLRSDVDYFGSRMAMPLAIVERDEKFLGFLMKEFGEGCYFDKTFSSGEVARTLFEVKVLLNSESERKELSIPSLTTIEKFALITDLLDTLAKLHEQSLVVGDLSGSNLVLQRKASRTNLLRVLFLDVDSFRVDGGRHPAGSESTLHWRSPEELSNSHAQPSTATDVYKAALLIRRLLHQVKNTGHSSYDIYKSRIANNILVSAGGKQLAELVALALDPVVTNRPKAMVLAFHFRKALERLRQV